MQFNKFPEWIVSIPKMLQACGKRPEANCFEDFMTVSVGVDGKERRCRTHLFGKETRLIPYSDLDGESDVKDADGQGYSRGDAFLVRVFQPGEIGIQMKIGRCHSGMKGRKIQFPMNRRNLEKHLQLHNLHAGFVVGADDRNGAPGVVGLHMPQEYQKSRGRLTSEQKNGNHCSEWKHVGRLGKKDSLPLVFFRLTFPEYISDCLSKQFQDNIRTMAVCFNAVAHYPEIGNVTNDLLAACSVKSVREHVKKMVVAIAGGDDEREQARAWFQSEDYRLYCSEYVYLTASAGIHCPLNAKTLVPMVGERTWQQFAKMVQAHNDGQPSPFQKMNRNPLVCGIKMGLADASLRPLPDYAKESLREAERSKLAFRPMRFQEMVQCFLNQLVDESSSEERQAPPSLEAVGCSDKDLLTMKKLASSELSRENHMIPPALFHYVAKGCWEGGLLGLSYEAHGIHISLMKKVI